MNKCLVCGKEYEGPQCPRCDFPAVVLMKITPEVTKSIANYREMFFQNIQIGIISYSWKDKDGYLVLDQEHQRVLGSCRDLLNGTIWLNQQFARIPDVDDLELRIFVNIKGEVSEKNVKIPNIKSPYLQEIGVSMDENMQVVVHLKNENGETSESQPMELF